ncbi:SDR family NAD(P)-dependent oxidoreductase [Nodularia spumigena CS-584]|jgi:short-subunit dehydrogenase|uniref:SDR family NAD(P)-dependent oxidoreductase n=1 Tax=Nodularia spumigena UHCC 0060 TaxID=3110300 RepID=A0ABU5UNY3_NODSP|nr:SDR family NAD(P)-dependent oxidoreductase [Nodularia spumigena]AHJ28833.1 3-oxoacyl-[acyl-carrier protein] reductase [Nodularia spumigena CCY9414]EAW43551.1 short chain dehydrogenase [Nodularia spumigena CCY9414]MDB9381151.1 SDR family NAD(P)-dependent oxidoreductase [Nodularia spumigena CS-584]MEA5524487.1 SDR family NAD(P)-dependent oxidoreductase [Nodularia spumigena UHCC 0143]MEA5607949.1 SDR family NAD(P)-dependent oxidoreductase [Nodularia spumigena UHCC 0060]
MTKLDQAVVLITGASGGFGKELTRQLLQAGSRLILTDLDETVLREQVQAIQHQVTTGDVLACLAVDLSTREGCEILYHQVKALNIPVDILINNAGIALFGNIEKIPNDKWERLMQINLLTPMRLSSLFVTDMIARQQGHIVNISSIAGWWSMPGLTHYAASKFALRGFSEGLFHEVKDYNIKVTVVYPFLSRTPIIDCEKFGSLNRNNQESLNNIATDPAKVMRVTIKGIIHNKLHIFPDATSQKAHILKRYFPQIMSLISDILVKRSKVGQGK